MIDGIDTRPHWQRERPDLSVADWNRLKDRRAAALYSGLHLKILAANAAVDRPVSPPREQAADTDERRNG